MTIHLAMMQGDLALTTVVGIIKENIRRTDMLVRMGGDEFLLVMPDIGEQAFADKLNQIQEKVHSSKVPIFTASYIGKYRRRYCPGSGNTVEQAIRKADQFMHFKVKT